VLPVATVVVCDDDPLLRAAITVAAEEAGLEVVAETDRGDDAVELVRRFGVDVLVLDVSLADGTGDRAVEELLSEHRDVVVVVFTAYASERGRLLRLGVREVIEKPDLELLQQVLDRTADSVESSAPRDDRRLASRGVRGNPRLWRSPAGVSARDDLKHSLEGLEVGDAALAVTVVGLESLEADVGALLTADCRLAVAGSLRDELRIQDLLHEAPEVDGFVALIRGGDARAAGAVWSRLTAALRGSSIPGEVKGAASRVDALGPADAVARAIGALQRAAVGSPGFVSV
jgi:CheY-like chemotaxis protein